MDPTRHRSRIVLVLPIAGVIALGLASRRFPHLFPAALGKYPGDALWAWMVLLLVLLTRPSLTNLRAGTIALALSCVDEATQAIHTPWLDAIRAHPLGHLVLGSQFSWLDMAAYAVGIAIGMAADAGALRLRSTAP